MLVPLNPTFAPGLYLSCLVLHPTDFEEKGKEFINKAKSKFPHEENVIEVINPGVSYETREERDGK